MSFRLTNLRALVMALVFAVMTASFTSPSFAQSQLSDAEVLDLRSQAQTAFADKRNQDALNLISQVVVARPADLKARFFRAQVLATMGRGAEIREELVLMTTLKLPAADLDRAKALIEAIDKSEERLSLNASIKLSYGGTDNANSFSKTGNQTSSSGTVTSAADPVNEKYKPITDALSEGSISLYGSYDINEARDLKSNFTFSMSKRNGADTHNMDRTYRSASVGLEKSIQSYTIKGTVFNSSLDRHQQVNGTKLSTTDIGTTTLSLEGSRKFESGLTVGYRFANAKNEHKNTSKADQYDSSVDTHSLFAGQMIGKTMYARGTLAFAKSQADNDDVANTTSAKSLSDKDTTTASLLLVKILPMKQRITGNVSYSDTSYDSNMVGTGIKRSDQTTSLSVGYQIPAEVVWQPLEGFVFGVDGSYRSTASNQLSAEVEAKQYTFSISRKFQL